MKAGTQKVRRYKDVCTDTTGHVEVVEVDFDPARVSYDDTFYRAEECHQQYLAKRGVRHCHI